jgi:hypothetical protein
MLCVTIILYGDFFQENVSFLANRDHETLMTFPTYYGFRKQLNCKISSVFLRGDSLISFLLFVIRPR